MRATPVMLALIAVLSSCTRETDADASTVSTSSSAPIATAPTPTTDGPTSTTTAPVIAETPTVAPSTTGPPVAQSTSTTTASPPATTTSTPAGQPTLLLRSDGLGPLTFGTPEGAVLAVLEPALGVVSSEVTNTYPIDNGDGTFLSEPGGEAFTHHDQRTACFDNALCVVFGGAGAGARTMVGWMQTNRGVDPPLATATGVTAGSVWADHLDDLEVPDSGCYSYSSGTTDGIYAELYSAGDPFLAYDAEGNEIETDPAPSDVSVIELWAGERPFYPEGDC